MDQETKDQGIIAVLLKRFETEQYPRAQLIKTKVDNGDVLHQPDMQFIKEILDNAHQEMAIILRHPEYASLAKEVVLMFEEIMSKSQENSTKVK